MTGGSQDVTIMKKTSISTCINLYQQSMQETMETTSHWITAMVNSEISVGTFRCQLRWLEHLAVRLKIPTKNPPFLGEYPENPILGSSIGSAMQGV